MANNIDIETGEIVEAGDTELFPMLNPDPEMREILLENLGGEIEASLLPRIKVPRGDTKAYELQTLEGIVYKPSFEAIILGTIRSQAYWPKQFGEDGSVDEPPLCSASRAGDSQTVMIGHVDPERRNEMPSEWLEQQAEQAFSCLTCPLNQFGSHPSGDSRKACVASITLVLLRPGHALPTLMQLPPTSMKNFKQYGMSLTLLGSKTSAVLTNIGCVTAQSSTGINYGQVTFELGRPLDERAARETANLRNEGGLVRNVIATLSRTDQVGALTTGATAPAPALAPTSEPEYIDAEDLSLAELEKLTQPKGK